MITNPYFCCHYIVYSYKVYKRNIYKPFIPIYTMETKQIKQTIQYLYNRVKGLFQPHYIDVARINKFKEVGITPYF